MGYLWKRMIGYVILWKITSNISILMFVEEVPVVMTKGRSAKGTSLELRNSMNPRKPWLTYKLVYCFFKLLLKLCALWSIGGLYCTEGFLYWINWVGFNLKSISTIMQEASEQRKLKDFRLHNSLPAHTEKYSEHSQITQSQNWVTRPSGGERGGLGGQHNFEPNNRSVTAAPPVLFRLDSRSCTETYALVQTERHTCLLVIIALFFHLYSYFDWRVF